MIKSVTVWIEQLIVGGECRMGVDVNGVSGTLEAACLIADGQKILMGQLVQEIQQPQPFQLDDAPTHSDARKARFGNGLD